MEERLTKKYYDWLHYDDGMSHYVPTGYAKPLEKLGQLEDIEEDLGVDLITLFKALKNKIKVLDNGLSYTDWCDLVYIRDGKSYLYCPISDHKVFIKDFGKTWALDMSQFSIDK